MADNVDVTSRVLRRRIAGIPGHRTLTVEARIPHREFDKCRNPDDIRRLVESRGIDTAFDYVTENNPEAREYRVFQEFAVHPAYFLYLSDGCTPDDLRVEADEAESRGLVRAPGILRRLAEDLEKHTRAGA